MNIKKSKDHEFERLWILPEHRNIQKTSSSLIISRQQFLKDYAIEYSDKGEKGLKKVESVRLKVEREIKKEIISVNSCCS